MRRYSEWARTPQAMVVQGVSRRDNERAMLLDLIEAVASRTR